ncbi:MAG: CHASE2 domain-containing protein [Ectothiorhodospiraceae bacterium]|nr:CHASE2 domain-containing protein [Ectothiorhodospiraceae bacterium]
MSRADPDENGRREGLGLPRRHIVQSLALLAVALVAIAWNWLWRYDLALYDVALRLWSRPAPADVVIVAIDEPSLEALGRWPWSRRIHAALVDRLAAAGAGAIGLDLVLAEPQRDDPGADAALARAISAHGRVVMPVVPEQRRLGGQIIETLPIETIAGAARAFGHVDVEIDGDGLSRRLFLAAGVGAPHWRAFALALLEVSDPRAAGHWPSPPSESGTGLDWVRAHEILVPFAGPPGHFRRVSYVDVLGGRVPASELVGRTILVGATTAGLGDTLPTPVSAQREPMAGVELHANVLDTLRNEIRIEAASLPARLTLATVLLLVPLIAYPRLSPMASLVASIGLSVGSLGLSAVLLVAGVWMPPVALALALAATYPLWTWARLEAAVHHMDAEVARLDAQRRALDVAVASDRVTAPAAFLARVLPFRGWWLRDAAGQLVAVGHEAPRGVDPDRPPPGIRRVKERVRHAGAEGASLTIWLAADAPAGSEDAIRSAVHGAGAARRRAAVGSLELVQQRIEQVQEATQRLRDAQRVIEESVAQMPTGVLVAGIDGRVVLANRRAAQYLTGDPGARLGGLGLLDLLDRLSPEVPTAWGATIGEVLGSGQSPVVDARGAGDRDLVAQISALVGEGQRLRGLVVSLADVSALRASERARAELLAFLSHDLRAPLVSSLSVVEMSHHAEETAALRAALERTGQLARRTLELAEQFLTFSEASSSGSGALGEMDVVTVALQAADEVWPQAEQQGVRIESRIETDEAWMEGDPQLVERAVVNLLVNAVRHSARSAVVELVVSASDHWARVAVVDHGRGVAPELAPHVFERYRRGSAQDTDHAGAGLGLAIVKAVAERHGGRASLETTPGGGATFVLTFPRAPDA